MQQDMTCSTCTRTLGQSCSTCIRGFMSYVDSTYMYLRLW